MGGGQGRDKWSPEHRARGGLTGSTEGRTAGRGLSKPTRMLDPSVQAVGSSLNWSVDGRAPVGPALGEALSSEQAGGIGGHGGTLVTAKVAWSRAHQGVTESCRSKAA